MQVARNQSIRRGFGARLFHCRESSASPSPPTYATVQRRVLRWRRTRNFIIIRCTISGLIVIGEIAERTEERRQVSTFSSSSGFISEVRERTGSHVFSCVTALQREKKRPLKGQGQRRGLSRRNIVSYKKRSQAENTRAISVNVSAGSPISGLLMAPPSHLAEIDAIR